MLHDLARAIKVGPEAAASEHARSGRDPEPRRRYAEDPHAYFRDVLGATLSSQQEAAIEHLRASRLALIPSGTNIGKTFLLGGLALWRFDAVAALPGVGGLGEQGCILLLVGPSHAVVRDTLYGEMLAHAERAESRGYTMPMGRSDKSVNWRVSARWFVRAMAPPAKAGENVSTTLSGRHHKNMVAFMEEAMGVRPGVWDAVQGACSAEGNNVWCAFNPTEPSGRAFDEVRGDSYSVMHLSGLDHPNVRSRKNSMPGAVSYEEIDRRVAAECEDRGTAGVAPVEPARHDFVYALPPSGAAEAGPRDDGHPGHAAGHLRVYRPSPLFTSQVLGQFPSVAQSGLIDPAAWDESVHRWMESGDPQRQPDMIGVDCAREGADDTVLCKRWGRPAAELLRAWRELSLIEAGAREAREPDIASMSEDEVQAWIESEAEATVAPVSSESIDQARARVLARHRVRVSEVVVLEKGTGPEVARRIAEIGGPGPYSVDEGSVGASVYDHLSEVMGLPAVAVAFGGEPEDLIPGEQVPQNRRTQMYLRAASLINQGLVDVPPDSRLREELMAHQLRWTDRYVTKSGRQKGARPAAKRARQVVGLSPKDAVKTLIGRSPDRADAFVLSLLGKTRSWTIA